MQKSNWSIYFALLGLVFISACTREGPPADLVVEERPIVYHIVREGQDLESIARIYNMSREDLVRLNHLREPYQIFVGQRLLVVPTLASALSSAESYSYGDSQGVQMAPHSPGQYVAEPEPQKLTAPTRGAYQWPVRGQIIRTFKRKGPKEQQSDGISIAAPKGTPVRAVNNGVVAMTGNYVSGFGNVVVLKHDGGLMSVYAHLNDVMVKRGQKVHSGQKIGAVGNTGYVKKTQLHFQLRRGTTPINPTTVLK